METKSIFKSKTFWVNIIMALLGCLAVFTPELLAGLGLGEHATEKALVVIGSITTFLNIVLRFLTTTQIKFIVLLFVIFGMSSCVSMNSAINWAKKNGTVSQTTAPNGVVTTTAKVSNFYNPEKIKQKFSKFLVLFDAVQPSITLTTATKDTSAPIVTPTFKK